MENSPSKTVTLTNGDVVAYVYQSGQICRLDKSTGKWEPFLFSQDVERLKEVLPKGRKRNA